MKKKILSFVLIVMLLVFSMSQAFAVTEYYYKGNSVSLGDGVVKASGTYNYYLKNGQPQISKPYFWSSKKTGTYQVKKVANHHKCLTYYMETDGTPLWIANQGQTVSVTQSSTVSRSVSKTVTREIGVSMSGKYTPSKGNELGITFTTAFKNSNTSSYSYTYTTGLGVIYNMSEYKKASYTIATMGIIEEFKVYRYKEDGSLWRTDTMYAYWKDYGQEIRLVYRY